VRLRDLLSETLLEFLLRLLSLTPRRKRRSKARQELEKD
jgi:hypothetical protein